MWDTVAHILNSRYNDRRTTIITTNYPNREALGAMPVRRTGKKSAEQEDAERAMSGETLGDRIGERMRSRLQEMCVVVEMHGKDFRQSVKLGQSAATLSFSSREDSDDPKIAEIIAHAESIFIAGGDQSDYVRFWQDTPVESAINRHIALGKPIGGSSAGLAILGQFSFSSMIDTIHSPEALADPYGTKVTLTREFLDIPLLRDTITDTHFVKRDRLGRLLVFMARILEDGWTNEVRAIAIEENAAVLIEPDGLATVVGTGPAYFLESTRLPEVSRTNSH